ncbi:MAG: hypothetical protein QM758_04195 [Armatimonas sp.]
MITLAWLLGGLALAVRYTITTSLRYTVEEALDRQVNKMPPPPNFTGGTIGTIQTTLDRQRLHPAEVGTPRA